MVAGSPGAVSFTVGEPGSLKATVGVRISTYRDCGIAGSVWLEGLRTRSSEIVTRGSLLICASPAMATSWFR